jgi:hypothetical protein
LLFRCLVKYGHNGSGRYVERAVLVRARDATHAFLKAKRLRGVKKGYQMRSGASVLAVTRVQEKCDSALVSVPVCGETRSITPIGHSSE